METHIDPKTEELPAAADDSLVRRQEAPRLFAVDVCVSDMHLGAGEKQRLKIWRSVATRVRAWLRRETLPAEFYEVENKLEDFPLEHDKNFAEFLAKAFPPTNENVQRALIFNGDVFDPLAVAYDGKMIDPPYEHECTEKMWTILRGHPIFCDGVAAFLMDDPNSIVIINTGNHDFSLVFDGVKEAIARRFSGGDPEIRKRITFVDHRDRYRHERHGVLYVHGNESEPFNYTDPKDAIITERLGIKLARPVLNHPLGNLLAVDVVGKIKWDNHLVGRAANPVDSWLNALLHRLRWAFLATFVYLYYGAKHLIVGNWFVKKRTGMRMVWLTLLSTIKDTSTDAYGHKVLAASENLLAVILGHSHVPKIEGTLDKKYVNTGTWSLMYILKYPFHEPKWQRFRIVERGVRMLQNYLNASWMKLKVLAFLVINVAMFTFLFWSFPHAWKLGDFPVSAFKLPLWFLAAYFFFWGASAVIEKMGKPEIIETKRLTYAYVEHFTDRRLTTVALKEFIPNGSLQPREEKAAEQQPDEALKELMQTMPS